MNNKLFGENKQYWKIDLHDHANYFFMGQTIKNTFTTIDTKTKALIGEYNPN